MHLFSQSYQMKVIGQGSQRLVNWYFETYEDGATKTPSAVVPTEGAIRVCVVGALPSDTCRGLFFSSSGPASSSYKPRLYGVWGNKVYRSNSVMTAMLEIGNVASNGNPVSMCDNGFYFVVVDGAAMYKASLKDVDGSPVYSQVLLPIVPTTSQFALPTHCAFIGQRIVINSVDSNAWFYSDFTDPTTLTGGETFRDGQFYYAESSSDTITSLMVVNGTLWIFGLKSYEVWGNNNNQDKPFVPVGGSANAIGCLGRYSAACVGEYGFWLGSSDVGTSNVYMSKSGVLKDISQGCMDQIAKMQNKDSAIGFAYSENGHIFYVLTFKYSNRTFVFDATTNKWHERLLRNVNEGTYEAWPYAYCTIIEGKIYTGLISNESCLCVFDETAETEWDGRLILREGVSNVQSTEGLNVLVREITMDMETGTTLQLDGIQSDPSISLEISRDGGYTYGNSVSKKIGKQGVYKAIVRWFGIGIARSFVFRFRTTKKCTIYGARVDFDTCGRS